MDQSLVPSSAKTYECYDNTFLSVGSEFAEKIDKILMENSEYGLWAHKFYENSLVIITYPSAKRFNIIP